MNRLTSVTDYIIKFKVQISLKLRRIETGKQQVKFR